MVSLGGLARKIFGSSNDRRVKIDAPRVEAINAMENELAALSDDELRARTDDVPRRPRRRRDALTIFWSRPLPRCARPPSARSAMRPFDVQLIGGMVLHSGRHRRDAHRRRQDAGRHLARLSERACRQGRACRHRQRLPGQPRRRVDGPHLQVPRAHRRRHRARARATRSAAPPMPATSPTAPTTNSASTICATT